VTTLSKKHQPLGSGDLKARIERTRREGKYQQALDLVKQLHRAEPTPEHKELLKDTYFQRAAQLRSQNYLRDAVTVLEVAAKLDEQNLDWITRIAGEMARCGDVARTLALAARLPEDARSGIMGPIVDGAMLQGKAGRDALPAHLQSEYDLVVKSFAQVEASQDDPARETLQSIGLRSPFLEWKVLLRGLQAYYSNDDDRARENWQRLAPERLPARLAAPFRAAIDPAYRAAQPEQTRAQLTRQYDQLQANPEAISLRDLRADFGNPDAAPRVYRAVEQLLPRLKQEAPHLVARLARCFYWSLVETGPDDITRYKRVFGAPPDDRNLHRLQATAYQRHGSFLSAHDHWLKYEQEIAAHPEVWPGEQAKLARALVWLQMAQNAALVPTEKQLKKLPRLARLFEQLPQPPKPTAEECFRRSIELAPTLCEAHEGLFLYHSLQEDDSKAISAAEKLLEVFPDHVKTLDALAALFLKRGRPAESSPLLERALNHNPLSRDLRQHMQLAQSSRARQLTVKGKFDDARSHFQSTVTFSEPRDLCAAYCQWAACEMKAGDNARADELLEQARAHSPGELLISYNLLVESNRLTLANSIKTRYTKAFNADITGTGTPGLALALVNFVYSLDAVDINYHGRATHWKKIFEYAGRIDFNSYSEAQLDALLADMVLLDPPKRMLRKMIDHARIKYPANPYFAYYDLVYLMGDDPEKVEYGPWRVMPLANHVEELARKWPADERLESMLKDLRQRQETLRLFNPLAGLFGGGFDPFAGGFDDFFGDDDDDF